jgi:hypothetical protein
VPSVRSRELPQMRESPCDQAGLDVGLLMVYCLEGNRDPSELIYTRARVFPPQLIVCPCYPSWSPVWMRCKINRRRQ